MQPLPPFLLARQRLQASDTMFDTCQVLARQQAATDGHNRPTYSYTAQPVTACGVHQVSNKEAEAGGKVVLVDYEIRLPHGTAVAREDRLRLLTRYGAPSFTPVNCEIVGEVEHGPTAVIVKLKVIVSG